MHMHMHMQHAHAHVHVMYGVLYVSLYIEE